jgi:acetamidase/formamidase
MATHTRFDGVELDGDAVIGEIDGGRAVLNAINYLHKVGGYTREQAYLLLSGCPCEGRLAGVLEGAEITEGEIMRYAAGIKQSGHDERIGA